MSLSQIKNALQFQVLNVAGGPIEGHLTVIYGIMTGKYVFRRHGDYGGLNYYKKLQSRYRLPSPGEKRFLDPIIERIVGDAAHYPQSYPYKKHTIFMREALYY